jgi:hypothetical protein
MQAATRSHDHQLAVDELGLDVFAQLVKIGDGCSPPATHIANPTIVLCDDVRVNCHESTPEVIWKTFRQ